MSSTIRGFILGLLRAPLKTNTEEIIRTLMGTSGKDTPRIRQILMLPNGQLKSWVADRKNVKVFRAEFQERIILVLVRDNHRHPHNYITYGKWNIEGEFLITYSPTGRRAAHKIPSDAKAIYERRNDQDAQH